MKTLIILRRNTSNKMESGILELIKDWFVIPVPSQDHLAINQQLLGNSAVRRGPDPVHIQLNSYHTHAANLAPILIAIQILFSVLIEKEQERDSPP